MIEYATIGVEEGDPGDTLTIQEMLWLAQTHAQEGTRLLNESVGLGPSHPRMVTVRDMATRHAALASSYAQIAQAKGLTGVE